MITLYKKGAHGINVWSIESKGNVIHIYGNGSEYTEEIKEGKAGRSIAEQVELRMNARIRGKLDDGFKESKEEAMNGEITNQLGLVNPMLATPLKNTRIHKTANYFIQPKLDGHRCLINSNGAYSRRGKPIETITEIVDSLNLPDNVTLDGELYLHGEPLQTIASWAKRRQANTAKLEYHVYDIIVHDDLDMTFEDRHNYLLEFEGYNVVHVDTKFYRREKQIIDYWKEFREQGYEGGILRLANSKYTIGGRSKHLIKIKSRMDEEFECMDVIPSREGWGILVLKTKEGRLFKTLAPGPVYQKIKTLEESHKYIGKHVTCEYPDKTMDGIPFHCVAIRWREDI